MAHDSDYFRRRAAEARSAAFHKDDGESVEVAGHLALAYAALARRRKAAQAVTLPIQSIRSSLPCRDEIPLMLRD